MARTFTAASNQYLAGSSISGIAYPCTLACWFNVTTANTQYVMVCADDNGNPPAAAFYIRTGSGGGAGSLVANVNNSAGATGATSTNFTANTWNHACGVFTSATSRACFLNGGGKGTSSTSVSVGTITTGRIGARGSGPANPTDGSLAECAIWNIALSDTEVGLLASATTPISPLLMHPEALVFYCPLVTGAALSPEIELMNAKNLTPSASPPTVATHPPIHYPSRRSRYRYGTTAVATDFIMGQMLF